MLHLVLKLVVTCLATHVQASGPEFSVLLETKYTSEGLPMVVVQTTTLSLKSKTYQRYSMGDHSVIRFVDRMAKIEKAWIEGSRQVLVSAYKEPKTIKFSGLPEGIPDKQRVRMVAGQLCFPVTAKEDDRKTVSWVPVSNPTGMAAYFIYKAGLLCESALIAVKRKPTEWDANQFRFPPNVKEVRVAPERLSNLFDVYLNALF